MPCRTSSPTKRELQFYTKPALPALLRQTCTFALLLHLAGCSTAPKLPERVLVPTPVSCLSAPPPEVPALTDESALLTMSEYEATIRTWLERLDLRAYAEKAAALLLACK